ncbi:SOS response-associated peptidase [Metabacillus sp. RGM 3146]|uniref:SOS response-associated peptidase n=1 Tax=Metabacillus sp. RGM 3146 TaxID=3401092 RepID=UPI003B992B7A
MCGRYSLFDDLAVLQETFHFKYDGEILPRYNIAPSQQILAITLEDEKRTGKQFRWGLIPPWSKDMKIGYKMINARSETAHEKASFKKPLQSKRCLIPCSGYYEWKHEGTKKQPYHFFMKNHEPFVFAGLYDRWQSEEAVIYSCTILTCEPNTIAEKVHDRMPVILSDEDQDKWLSHDTDLSSLKDLMSPYSADQMDMMAVSTLINSPKNETAEVLSPLNSK